MASAKRKRTSKTSKGERRSVVAGVKQCRQERAAFVAINKIIAWKQGKNPYMTVDTGALGSRERFKRVRMNTVMGDPRRRSIDKEAQADND